MNKSSAEKSSSNTSTKDDDDDDMVDITALVQDCASSLTNNTLTNKTTTFLCNPSTFDLHDAMTATQLMDPKMDCCEIPASYYYGNDETTAAKVLFPRPAPTDGLDDAFTPLPWNELTIRDAAFIVLQMLVRFEASLSGSSAGESTFTCLYAHAAVLADMRSRLFGDQPLQDKVPAPIKADRDNKKKTNDTTSTEDDTLFAQFIVFACALTLVEATEVSRGIVQNADIYEEEDFVANTYNIPFYTNKVNDIDALKVLEKAMMLTKQREKQGQEEIKIIMAIVGFLFGFLSICSKLGRLTTKSMAEDVEGSQAISRMAIQRLEFLEPLFSCCSVVNDKALQTLLRQTFDSFVNRPLVGNHPVRKPFFKPVQEAISSLKRITAEFDWAVCDLLLRGTTLGRIQRMLDFVQRSDVNILSRSLILLNLYFEDKLLGRYSMQPLIIDNMQQWTYIPDAFFANEHAKIFVDRLAKPVYETLKLRILNRSRQRAYIEGAMIQEWTSLQNEAHVIDVHYRRENGLDNSSTPPYFSQYVLTSLIRLMDRHLSSGLELELFYGFQDISLAYWYRVFLLSALLNHLSMMRRAKTLWNSQQKKPVPSSSSSSKQSDKGRGKKKTSKTKQQQRNIVQQERKRLACEMEDSFELALLDLKQELCRGIRSFIVALQQANILRSNDLEFTSLERIYEERFVGVFGLIRQPPLLSFQHFLEGTDFSNVSSEELLRVTAGYFASCRKMAERLLQDLEALEDSKVYAPARESELRALLKVCVGNSVYLHKLRTIIESSSNNDSEKDETRVVFDFEGYSEFCTIKLC